MPALSFLRLQLTQNVPHQSKSLHYMRVVVLQDNELFQNRSQLLKNSERQLLVVAVEVVGRRQASAQVHGR